MPLMPKPNPGEVVPLAVEEMMVLVHRTSDEKLETMLFDFRDHGPEAYGLIIADIIGHVAKRYGCDPEYVVDWVHKELDNPTTNLTRMGPN
ncbi:MAG: hypothetical protein ACR2OV_00030 [Hyphomicrobiaceae bacterium]